MKPSRTLGLVLFAAAIAASTVVAPSAGAEPAPRGHEEDLAEQAVCTVLAAGTLECGPFGHGPGQGDPVPAPPQ